MFDKIKTNVKKGVEKVKTVAVNNKDKLVKGAAIVGSGALAIGAIGFIKNRFGGNDYIEIDHEQDYDTMQLVDPETGDLYEFTSVDLEEDGLALFGNKVEDSKDEETEETE